MSTPSTAVEQVRDIPSVARPAVPIITRSQASTCLRRVCEAVLSRLARRAMH